MGAEHAAPPLLLVRDLVAGYGGSRVLHGVGLHVRAGEIVALLGRNGAGRSTTARALMGLLPPDSGVQGGAWLDARPLLGLPPFAIARLGMGYVPESRDIFPRLSVRQNLLLGVQPGRGARAAARDGLAEAFALFPVLQARQHAPAGVLSGGEQQMLALCRTLMGRPRLLLVDEPTEGLSPAMAQQVARCLGGLRARGVGVLLIEQKLTIALHLADRVLVMGQGRVVFDGAPAALEADTQVQQEWLGA